MSSIIRTAAPGRHRGSPGADPEPPPPAPGTCRSQIRGSARDHRGSPTLPRRRSRAPDSRSRTLSQTTGAPLSTRPALARRSHDRLLAGVASGVGDHFHIEPNLVRLAFVVLTFAGGAGIVLYAAGWLLLPTDDPSAAATATRGDRSRQRPGPGPGARRGDARGAAGRAVDRARFQRRAPLAARARGHGHRVDRRAQRSPDRRADRRAGPTGARARRRATDGTGPRRRRSCGSSWAAHSSSPVSAAFLATQGAFACRRAGAARGRGHPRWARTRLRAVALAVVDTPSSTNAASASGPTNAPRWPRTCTTRCCSPSR